jgi:16S rRNA processing protein RimM
VDPDEPAIIVGAITKAHGLRGEVAVEIRSDNPERFAPGSTMFLADGRRLTVERSHRHGSRLLVKYAGIEGRSQAEELRGQLVSVPEAWLPDLPDGEFWPFQLEGCHVVTESGRSIGRVTDVIPNPANDLWVTVDDDGAETFVPAIRDVVVHVDLRAKRIAVRDIPGLTTPEDPPPR